MRITYRKSYNSKNIIIGFTDIYTTEPAPKELVELPKSVIPVKKPYLILARKSNHTPAFYNSNRKLRDLGYTIEQNGNQYLVITSQRKVQKAIKILSAEGSVYDDPANKEAFECLRQQQAAFTSKVKTPPIKSKPQENYEDSSEEIHKSEPKAPQPRSQVRVVRHQNKNKLYVFKPNDSGRHLSELEAFNGICYRLLLNGQTPKVRSVHNSVGEQVGVLSEVIKDFRSLHDYYLHSEKTTGVGRSPEQSKLIKAHIGKILGAAYCEEENDLHGGNIGYKPKQNELSKIDPGQALWLFVAKYLGIHPKNVKELKIIDPASAFPISQQDITNFPHLQDAQPFQFPDKADGGLLDLKGIENNPDFIRDVFITFLKRTLIQEQVYRNIAEATISNEKLREEIIKHKTARGNLLKNELFKNDKFRHFIINNPNILDQILEELGNYNQDWKKDSNLQVNLVDIKTAFLQFKADIIANDSKTTLFEDVKKLDKADMSADDIITTPFEEVKKLDKTHMSANDIITTLFEEVKKLDKKVGAFGGEKREHEKVNYKLPMGAAKIFTLCKEYKMGMHSEPEEILKAIVDEASKASQYKGHTFLNQRHSETTDFYEKIVKKYNKPDALSALTTPKPDTLAAANTSNPEKITYNRLFLSTI